MTCSIKDCQGLVFSRTWCSKHYKRWYRYGNPLEYRLGTDLFKRNVSQALRKSWVDGKYKDRKTVIPWGWNKGIPQTEEVKSKISQTLTGRKQPQEVKEKISKTSKLNYQSGKRKPFFQGKEGIDTPNWKGDQVGYLALHAWVARKKGKPDTCEHCKTSKLIGHQIHWANVSQQYKRDVSDWIRLCAKCHKTFDKKGLQ